MKIFSAIVILLLLVSHYSYAEDDAITNEIIDNISSEFVECSCYYSIIAQGLGKKGEKPLAEKYKEDAFTAFSYAVTVAEEGRSKEMAQKVTLARFTLGMESMLKEINNDFSNSSILMNKYGFRCKDVMENPEAMMKELENKISKKHSQSNK